MIDRYLQPNHCGSDLQRAIWLPTIVTLLVASLPLFAAVVVAQDNAQPDPESQTLKVKVVDQEGEAVGGVILKPTRFQYEQDPTSNLYVKQPSVETDDEGEASLVFPVGDKGLISKVYLRVEHDSFLPRSASADIMDDPVRITLIRGVRIATSGLDPVTKKPIKSGLHAMTNRNGLVDWQIKSNGTLVSPIIDKEETCLRLVQLDKGKPIRFSKLIDIFAGEKNRLLFSDVEMVDAVTVTGKLGDEVPRPVKSGMINCCVVSASQHEQDPTGVSWNWRAFSELNPDGTFTLEGIPADSVLQVHCACKGWANKPPSMAQILAEFPKDANKNSSAPLPQIFQIGKQDTEITVAMQPLGSVTVKVFDQDDRPISKARASLTVFPKFFYSGAWGSYSLTHSSARRLTRLRSESDGKTRRPDLTIDAVMPAQGDRMGFHTDFAFHNFLTDATGSVVIDGVPPGSVGVSVSHPGSERGKEKGTVKSGENIDVVLKLALEDPKNGGQDD